MQVLEDGRLTDSQGRTVNFANTIVIMTSNIGSSYILEEDNPAEVERMVSDALKNVFRPELLNRIDATLIFKRLSKESIRNIVDIQLKKTIALLKNRNIVLEITDNAKDRLAELGYDPAFGARPLRRVIQSHILEPLSEKIITGELVEGKIAQIDITSDDFLISVFG